MNTDCPSGELCALGEGSLATSCGPLGSCSDDADCTGGDRCLALFGEDVRICVPPTGTCTSVADCGVGQLCGVAPGATTVECLP